MRFVVIGAAGQAREMDYYLRAMGHWCAGFLVTDLDRLGPNDSRERVLGDFSWLESHVGEIDAFAMGIGAPRTRLRLADALRGRYPVVAWPPVIHPSATFDSSTVEIGLGVMIGAGATLTVNVKLGDFCLINFGATVGHESTLGRGCVINPGANVSGGVNIGDGALIGTNAVVLQYRSIGQNATVGAGAVVTRDVPPGTTVVGVPARPMAPQEPPRSEP